MAVTGTRITAPWLIFAVDGQGGWPAILTQWHVIWLPPLDSVLLWAIPDMFTLTALHPWPQTGCPDYQTPIPSSLLKGTLMTLAGTEAILNPNSWKLSPPCGQKLLFDLFKGSKMDNKWNQGLAEWTAHHIQLVMQSGVFTGTAEAELGCLDFRLRFRQEDWIQGLACWSVILCKPYHILKYYKFSMVRMVTVS